MEPPTFSFIRTEFGDRRGTTTRTLEPESIIRACEVVDDCCNESDGDDDDDDNNKNYNGLSGMDAAAACMEPPMYSVIQTELGKCESVKKVAKKGRSADPATYSTIMAGFENVYQRKPRSGSSSNEKQKQQVHRTADPAMYSIIKPPFEEVYQKEEGTTEAAKDKNIKEQKRAPVPSSRARDPATYSVIMAQFEEVYQKKEQRATSSPKHGTATKTTRKSTPPSSSKTNNESGPPKLSPTHLKKRIFLRFLCCSGGSDQVLLPPTSPSDCEPTET